MIDISFVQSEFQLSIATTVTPNSQIVNVRRPLRFRVQDTLIAAARLLFALFSRKKIAIYDHRNILTVIVAVLCKAAPSRYDFIYIGDDGLHSLVVDKYGDKHLCWRTKALKRILLRALEKEVLSLKRIHALKDMRVHSVKGSVFADFYNRSSKSEKKLVQSAIFIDQPGVIDFMNEREVADFSALLNTFKDIEVILHPRRKSDAFYRNLGLVARISPNIEGELSSLNNGIEVVGHFSTVLLAGKIFGHKVTPIPLPEGASEEFKAYSSACLKVIVD